MDDLWSLGGVSDDVADLREPTVRRSRPGARVLILRAHGQASVLRDELHRRGASTVSVPVLEIAPPSSYEVIDHALSRMDTFDWVVLTSANAADGVAARLPGGAVFARLAVIGAATLARVREMMPELNASAVLVPPRAVGESLADVLEPKIRELVREQGVARVLLPRAEQARDLLPERLRAAGAEVVVAPAYRNVIPEESVPLLRRLFARQALWPDVIPFTSSSSVTHLLAVLDAAGETLPGEILRVSIGPVTSATLRENGLPPQAEAAEATVGSLAEAVVAAVLQSRGKTR